MSKKLYKTIRLNKPMGISLPAGLQRDIEVDSEEIPTEIFWRLALKDAKTDNCVEWVKPKSEPKHTKSSTHKANRSPLEAAANVD